MIDAMEKIEQDYETLRGALPKAEYQELDNDVLDFCAPSTTRPSRGRRRVLYEYFLTQFADQKAHDGGEFFTPVALVQTIVNVIEPDHGRPGLRLGRDVRAERALHRRASEARTPVRRLAAAATTCANGELSDDVARASRSLTTRGRRSRTTWTPSSRRRATTMQAIPTSTYESADCFEFDRGVPPEYDFHIETRQVV